MEWRQYPSRKNRFGAKPEWRERTGQVWSDAPGGQWVVPDDAPGTVVLVKRRPGSDERYAYDEEQP